LSEYLEKNRGVYYDKLTLTRNSNDIAQWIKFFLVAVIETSKKGIETFEKIMQLREKIEGKQIIKLGKKLPIAKELMNVLYSKPSVTAAEVARFIEVTPATANALIRNFVDLSILTEVTGGKRNRRFIFKEYINLFQK
jgi:Fic family protein